MQIIYKITVLIIGLYTFFKTLTYITGCFSSIERIKYDVCDT